MRPRNKGSEKKAMGMIPATALVLITIIAVVGAVEIGILAVSSSAQASPMALGDPGATGSNGNGVNSSQPSPGAVQVTILVGSSTNIKSPGFSPDVIVVVFGVNNTVTWTNDDSVPHAIASNIAGFDSGNLSTGQSFTYTFSKFGTFNIQCKYYPWIQGMVIVENPFAV
jgi:plastocyanin